MQSFIPVVQHTRCVHCEILKPSEIFHHSVQLGVTVITQMHPCLYMYLNALEKLDPHINDFISIN